jgi:hypothetical protein
MKKEAAQYEQIRKKEQELTAMRDQFTQQQTEINRQRQGVEDEYQRLAAERLKFEAEKRVEEEKIREA